MCGGTRLRYPGFHPLQGLSPLVRGNPDALIVRVLFARSIPACAGEPAATRLVRSVMAVYPRLCGGTGSISIRRTTRNGLSPLVRGNHNLLGLKRFGIRSIPACAGEPWSFLPPVGGVEVYPRLCGGTFRALRLGLRFRGLSPLVRGNLAFAGFALTFTRSIPACAGEPPSRAAIVDVMAVYPRLCGGTMRV